jgi:hypothetical protein
MLFVRDFSCLSTACKYVKEPLVLLGMFAPARADGQAKTGSCVHGLKERE